MHVRSVVRRAVGIVITLGVLSGLIGAAARADAAGCRSWKVQPSPNPGGKSNNNVLAGVAATSGKNAWAVGDYFKGPGARTLIQHWNGRAWTVQKSPNPAAGLVNYLQGAAATSSTNAWAVGEYHTGAAFQPLIEHWNGKAWKVQKSSNPGGTAKDNSLFGVAANSATDAWAVGDYFNGRAYRTLVEHWNGKAWKVQKSPNPGGTANDNHLYAVTATSSTNAWAVGEYHSANGNLTLIEHWNGKAWKVKPSPNPARSGEVHLTGVAATSPSNAWAVGHYLGANGLQPLVEHWNGKAWKIKRTPKPGGQDNLLFGVAPTSASNVWVGGYSSSRTLFEHWNGTAWKLQKTPNPGAKANQVFGMAAVSASNVWAVGDYYDGSHARTLTMRCG